LYNINSGCIYSKPQIFIEKSIDGLRVIKDGNFIAVLHDYPDMAEKAVAMIKAEYDMLRILYKIK